jgi:hypothetical protein
MLLDVRCLGFDVQLQKCGFQIEGFNGTHPSPPSPTVSSVFSVSSVVIALLEFTAHAQTLLLKPFYTQLPGRSTTDG